MLSFTPIPGPWCVVRGFLVKRHPYDHILPFEHMRWFSEHINVENIKIIVSFNNDLEILEFESTIQLGQVSILDKKKFSLKLDGF